MKNFLLPVVVLISFLLLLFPSSCKKANDNPFDDKAKKAYEAVMALQEESDEVLAGFQATMDSAAAVNALAQWFRDNELVQSALISSQGISVIYTNGIWGGILIDPKRYDEPGATERAMPDYGIDPDGKQLKNLPTKKSTLFLAASYSEFPVENLRQNDSWKDQFEQLDYEYTILTNTSINLNYLADIQEVGSFICFDSHGYAWPASDQISEVFFLTGEKANLASTEKYFQDILDHNIILLYKPYDTIANYFISPGFITNYNDFSNDTVLFFGSFCYSYLGNWPSLTDACASGTYFGFDWYVNSNKCTDWAIDLVMYLADQDYPDPYTVDEWMTGSEISKSYVDVKSGRTISILYNGNSDLTLWKAEYDTSAVIEAVAPDGAPIQTPGLTCMEYTLRCKVKGQLPAQVRYSWDFGGGQNYGATENLVNCLWIMPGNYTVSVQVINDANNEVLKEITGQVQIEDPSFLSALQTLSILECSFDESVIHLTDTSFVGLGFFNFETDELETPLYWSDSNFYAQTIDSSGTDVQKKILQGTMTSDGKIMKHMLWTIIEKHNGVTDLEVTMEIIELPVFIRDEWNCDGGIGFNWEHNGQSVQNYVVNLDYKRYDYQNQIWITIQDIDWANSYFHGYFTN